MMDHSGIFEGSTETVRAPVSGGGRRGAFNSLMKRVIDLSLALPLLVFLSPILLLIALIVRMSDGGTALYAQKRCGAHNKVFTCYKFRTMRVDADKRLEALLASDPVAAEQWREYQKLDPDPRITAVGGFLRKSSLDELPQLINILRGEMSIIGPRPVTPREIHRYGEFFAYYSAVRPGVTGLWQVNGRNKLTYPERVALDVQYVRNWSIWMDLAILAKTVPAVLFGSGAK